MKKIDRQAYWFSMALRVSLALSLVLLIFSQSVSCYVLQMKNITYEMLDNFTELESESKEKKDTSEVEDEDERPPLLYECNFFSDQKQQAYYTFVAQGLNDSHLSVPLPPPKCS